MMCVLKLDLLTGMFLCPPCGPSVSGATPGRRNHCSVQTAGPQRFTADLGGPQLKLQWFRLFIPFYLRSFVVNGRLDVWAGSITDFHFKF